MSDSGLSTSIKRSIASCSALFSIKKGIIYSTNSNKSSVPYSFSILFSYSSDISRTKC